MDRLWSPWRYRYVSSASQSDPCIFCAKSAANQDEEHLIVHRGSHNFVLLNLYPYTTGHLMVAPYAHIAGLDELPDETAVEMMSLTRLAIRILRAVYKPHGLNIGMNLGECAGAGVAGHAHMHVLPRWPGDASFMTSVAETRILPEELPITWRRLKEAFLAEKA